MDINWEAIGAIGEVVAAFAVVITLLLLVIQLRQNTAEVRANTIGSLFDKSIEMFGETMSSDIPVILAKHRRNEPLTDVENERFKFFVRRNLQIFEQVYLQFQQGRVSGEVMQAYDRRIMGHFAYPNWTDHWSQLKPLMTESFQQYVDGLARDA